MVHPALPAIGEAKCHRRKFANRRQTCFERRIDRDAEKRGILFESRPSGTSGNRALLLRRDPNLWLDQGLDSPPREVTDKLIESSVCTRPYLASTFGRGRSRPMVPDAASVPSPQECWPRAQAATSPRKRLTTSSSSRVLSATTVELSRTVAADFIAWLAASATRSMIPSTDWVARAAC